MTPEQILEAILNLPIKEALTYLTIKKIFDFSKKGYGKIKKHIQDKSNEKKYAFIPNKIEANLLLKINKNPQYREVEQLVPKYRYIDLIRTGLLICDYERSRTQKNDRRIKEMKVQIIRRPNGSKLLKIVDLPTTPFFSVILDFLHNCKKSNYSDVQLEEKFDELIDEWVKNSMLVKSEHKTDDIISFCESHIESKTHLFYYLGMKKAAYTVEEATNQLVEDKFFERNGYKYIIKKRNGSNPKAEVTVYLEEDLSQLSDNF